MSRVPLGVERPRRDGPFPPSYLEVIHGNLWAQFRISQVLAERWKITREDMDEYSLESHRRAAEATDSGHFAKEILPVPMKDENGAFTGETLSRRRGDPPRHDPREARCAAAGAELGAGHGAGHHRRELLADDRRGSGDARRRAIGRRTPRASDTGTPAALRGARRRRDARALGPGAGDPQAARAFGHVDRRLRRDRVQRGVRRNRSHVVPGLQSRIRTSTTPAAARSRSVTRSVRAGSGSPRRS